MTLIGEFDEHDALHGVVGHQPTLELVDIHGHSRDLGGNPGHQRVVFAFNPSLHLLGQWIEPHGGHHGGFVFHWGHRVSDENRCVAHHPSR